MVRTSQCFRKTYPQLDGPPTLAAAEGIPYTLALPASLIKPRRDFSRRHKRHFLVSHLSRSAVSPFSTEGRAASPDHCKDLARCRARQSVNQNQATCPREEVGGTVCDRQLSLGARHQGGIAWRRKRPSR